MRLSKKALRSLVSSGNFFSTPKISIETPEHALVWAVIFRAIFDACYETSDSDFHWHYQACQWIRSDSSKKYSIRYYLQNIVEDVEHVQNRIIEFADKHKGQKRKDYDRTKKRK